jgi:large subunit ribosomal protein L40e
MTDGERFCLQTCACVCMCMCVHVHTCQLRMHVSVAMLSQAMTKRPADSSWPAPVWCAKSRLEYTRQQFRRQSSIGEDDACQIITGSEVAKAGWHSPATSDAATQEMFVQRANDAALAFEMVKAYSIVASSAKDGDKTKESCGWECARLRAAASQTCKAQTHAWKAAQKASDALKAFAAASEAADECHLRFRKARDLAQQNAACNLDSEVLYKDAVQFELPNGICAVDAGPEMVGDISGGSRFFVRIISADAAFASWSCGFVTCLEVNERDTIASVKAKLQNKEGIPPEKIRLLYKGQKLRNQETLCSYGIVDDDETDWMIFGILAETLDSAAVEWWCT